jgi:hypothetical protein
MAALPGTPLSTATSNVSKRVSPIEAVGPQDSAYTNRITGARKRYPADASLEAILASVGLALSK